MHVNGIALEEVFLFLMILLVLEHHNTNTASLIQVLLMFLNEIMVESITGDKSSNWQQMMVQLAMISEHLYLFQLTRLWLVVLPLMHISSNNIMAVLELWQFHNSSVLRPTTLHKCSLKNFKNCKNKKFSFKNRKNKKFSAIEKFWKNWEMIYKINDPTSSQTQTF